MNAVRNGLMTRDSSMTSDGSIPVKSHSDVSIPVKIVGLTPGVGGVLC
jgi:hypothetical protein